MLRQTLTVCISLIISTICLAQTTRPDTAFVADARNTAIGLYSKAISAQSHLYNGSAYTEYISQREENPYFIDEWLEGTVLYDGEFHDHVFLLYDLSTDRLVVDNQYSIKKVMLVNEKVQAFSIQDHHFVHYTGKELPAGHYEVTYNGDTKVYVRHRKTLQSRVVDYSVFNEFEEKKLFFIYKDGKFYSVKSKGSVLKVLEDKKNDLKKFIRDNNLQFGNDRAKDISRVAQYYDQLK